MEKKMSEMKETDMLSVKKAGLASENRNNYKIPQQTTNYNH